MKTLNKKHRKFKLSLQIAAILSCVAIASVGFAGWIIVGNGSTDNVTGSVTAYTVTEEGFSFVGDIVVEGDKKNIVFGQSSLGGDTWLGTGESSTYHSYNWLVANGVDDENFSLNVPVEYEVGSNISKVTITVDFSAKYGETDASAKLAELITKNYITVYISASYTPSGGSETTLVTPGAFNATTSEISFELNATHFSTKKFNIQIQFAWGSAFGNGVGNYNPYIFFNGFEKTAQYNDQAGVTMKDAAKTALTAINDVVGNITRNEAEEQTADGTDMTYRLDISAEVSAATPAE